MLLVLAAGSAHNALSAQIGGTGGQGIRYVPCDESEPISEPWRYESELTIICCDVTKDEQETVEDFIDGAQSLWGDTYPLPD